MSDEAAEAWGGYAAAAYMYSTFFKGEERIAVDVAGSGALGGVTVECIPVGETRGTVHNPGAVQGCNTKAGQDQATAEQSLLGRGTMRVRKVLYGQTRPHETTLLSTGDALTDWCHFYQQSEQTATFVLLESSLNAEVPFIGGLTVQALPGPEGEATLFTMETRRDFGELETFSLCGGTSGVLEATLAALGLQGGAAEAVQSIAQLQALDYFCRCSTSGFLDRMASLPRDTLQELAVEGDAELRCQYCNEAHTISAEQIRSLLA